MAEKTTNFNLTKPNPEDFYNVNVQNENMDIIDRELKNRTPSLATYYPVTTAKNADELIDPFALIPVSLEVNSELFNIVGGSFAWVWTNFYIEASVTSRRMQIAMSYNTIHQKIAFRIYGAEGWLTWKEVANADDIPKAASDIGAIPSTGGIVSGQISFKKTNGLGYTKMVKNHSETADYGFMITDYDADGNHISICVCARDGKAYFIDNRNNYYELYHVGNKPSASDVSGAVRSVNGVTPDANGAVDLTDEINTLIATQLGVIENGTY